MHAARPFATAVHGACMGPPLAAWTGSCTLQLRPTQVGAMVGEVIGTRVQLTFTQLQNFIGDIALERNLTYFFWSHADVGALSRNATASFGADVIGCMDRVIAEQPRWGVVFFKYDNFAAYRTEMLRETRWDVFLQHYLADCDFYASVRAAGWLTLEHGTVCPATRVKVMRRSPSPL